MKLFKTLTILILLFILSSFVTYTFSQNKTQRIESKDLLWLPKWSLPVNLKIYIMKNEFTWDEQQKVKIGINSWKPFLPTKLNIEYAGETDLFQTCIGCVNIKHRPLGPDLGGCEPTSINGLTQYVNIIINSTVKKKVFQYVVEHELGHAFGLLHRSDSIMSKSYSKIRPSEKDKNVLNLLYPPQLESPLKITTTLVNVSDFELNLPPADVTKLKKQEQEMLKALQNYSFRREVFIWSLDSSGLPNGEYRRISQVVLGDGGQRIERVISVKSNLRGLIITDQDIIDFNNAQIGLIDFSKYKLSQNVNGRILVQPLIGDVKERVFKGEIETSSKGIERLIGTTLPEKNERFPWFVATRKEVDGHLFPYETVADDVLQFPDSAVRVLWIVTITKYKKFNTSVNIEDLNTLAKP